MIAQILHEGKEVHVFRYWQHSCDQGAKVIESATLSLPFTNQLNCQTRSIDLDLFEKDEGSNVQRQLVKHIKQSVDENHRKLDFKSLEDLIEKCPNLVVGQKHYKGEILNSNSILSML